MFALHPTLEKDSIHLGDFPLCQLRLINDTQYPWFILVPKRANICELYELSPSDQTQYLTESLTLSQAIMRAFKGEKLNTAALGNMVPQLHIHHIVRYENDPAWPGPIWGKHPAVAYTNEAFDALKNALFETELDQFTAA